MQESPLGSYPVNKVVKQLVHLYQSTCVEDVHWIAAKCVPSLLAEKQRHSHIAVYQDVQETFRGSYMPFRCHQMTLPNLTLKGKWLSWFKNSFMLQLPS